MSDVAVVSRRVLNLPRWRLHRKRALIIFSPPVILDWEFMKADEVITVPADGSP